MKHFTSYTIAIPLPEAFLREYAGFLSKVKSVSQDLDVAGAETPHISLAYLKKSAKSHLEEIAETTKNVSALVAGETVSIRGLRVFDPEFPRILYLAANASSKISQLNMSLAEEFNQYTSEDNELDFVPHLTLARLPENDNVLPFARTISRLKILADTIAWSFPITELAIYGVDNTQQPVHQEKLVTIPLEPPVKA